MNTSPPIPQQTSDLWMPAVVVGAIAGALIYFSAWGLALKFSTDEKFTFAQGIQSVTASFMPGTQPMDGVKDDLGSWLKNEHPAYLQVMTYVPYVGGTLVGLGSFNSS